MLKLTHPLQIRPSSACPTYIQTETQNFIKEKNVMKKFNELHCIQSAACLFAHMACCYLRVSASVYKHLSLLWLLLLDSFIRPHVWFAACLCVVIVLFIYISEAFRFNWNIFTNDSRCWRHKLRAAANAAGVISVCRQRRLTFRSTFWLSNVSGGLELLQLHRASVKYSHVFMCICPYVCMYVCMCDDYSLSWCHMVS